MSALGFDNQKYIQIQSEQIRKRIDTFGGKLYLEFGGKLFDDYHASRVLPGFEPDSKMRMLQQLKDDVEIVIAINADDIAKNKLRGDYGIPYGDDVLRLIDTFRKLDLYVGSVALTRYNAQPAADKFLRRLEALNIRCYKHYSIPGYPTDVPFVVSDEGLGRNEYIETTHSLIVVTAPGPGSGKMATCLSQLYHDYRRGITSGYAKFETFPIWNLPLKHPVNLAYEAATADLNDVNMIDPFHLDAYGEVTVNYNRDVETFPLLNALFNQIQGSSPYRSPTDMGVNMAGYCITDDEICCRASRSEILRRFYIASAEHLQGKGTDETIRKIESVMSQANVTPEIDPAVTAALSLAEKTGAPAAALTLPDGRVITGKTSSKLGAASALLLNSLKAIGGIDQELDLISPHVLEPICELKTRYIGHSNPRLHTDEVLLALTVCSLTNPLAQLAKEQLPHLSGCSAHFSVIISDEDIQLLKRLGVNVSCEPCYEINTLYHK